MNPGEEKRFDGLLRNKFSGFEADPSPQVWQSVSQTLPQAGPGLLSRAMPFGMGTLFGILLSAGLFVGYEQITGTETTGTTSTVAAVEQSATDPAGAVTSSNVAVSTAQPEALPAGTIANQATVAGQHTRINTTSYRHTRYNSASTRTTAASKSTTAQPSPKNNRNEAAPSLASGTNVKTATLQNTTAPHAANTASVVTATSVALNLKSTIWLIGHELDTAIAQVITPGSNETASDKQKKLKDLLKAQGSVLAVLQNRNDSMLLALNDAELDSSFARIRIPKPRKHQSSIKAPLGWSAPGKWAVAISYETTPQWGEQKLNPENGIAVEKIRTSRSADVRIKHRPNDRLSLSSGLGITFVESEMSYAYNQTLSGSVYIDKLQYLRPNYRFYNLPVAMHYKVGGYGHFGIGVSAGAQVNLLRSGTMPVWNEDKYELQKSAATDGPFRPVSVSITSGLDLNYRITQGISAQAGPTLRYWALSPFKQADNGFRFLPGMQLGLSFDL